MDFNNHEGFRRRMERKLFIFNEKCSEFSSDPRYNELFVRMKEDYLNARLDAVGYVFLNEVLKEFGIAPTMAGQIAGWKRKTEPVKHSPERLFSRTIEIKIEQTMYDGPKVIEQIFCIEHEGFILEVLEDGGWDSR